MTEKTLGPAEGEASPLAEASPHSLDDLMNMDPLLLQKQDRKVIIEYYRNARLTFLKEEAQGKRPGASKKRDAPKDLKAGQLKLDLSSLMNKGVGS